MDSRPITPSEIAEHKQKYLPSEVINVFNLLIVKYYSGGKAVVPAKEALELIATNLNISQNQVRTQKYLDVEDLYRLYGWHVQYSSPDYTETFDPYYTFQQKFKGIDPVTLPNRSNYNGN